MMIGYLPGAALALSLLLTATGAAAAEPAPLAEFRIDETGSRPRSYRILAGCGPGDEVPRPQVHHDDGDGVSHPLPDAIGLDLVLGRIDAEVLLLARIAHPAPTPTAYLRLGTAAGLDDFQVDPGVRIRGVRSAPPGYPGRWFLGLEFDADPEDLVVEAPRLLTCDAP